MSVRFGMSGGLFHQVNKLSKQVFRIARTRSGFGVMLYREGGQGKVTQAFGGLVVQIDVGGFHGVGQAVLPALSLLLLLRHRD